MRAASDRGFTVLEILMVVTLIGILAAIAVPRLLAARGSATEAGAIGAVRAATNGQSIFAATCGSGYYAPSLEQLATPPLTGGTGFVSPDLSSDPSLKSGYTVTLTPGAPGAASPASCNGAAAGTLVTTFFVAASPFEDVGSRHFGSNQSGTIYQSGAAVAPTFVGAPPGATPIQ